MKILVICAHPDDEAVSCGGVISKHSKQNDEIYVCVVSEGVSAQYSEKNAIETRREHSLKAGKILGIKKYFFHDLPDAKLDTVPQLEVNKIIESIIQKIKPEIVYTHFAKDLNKDHSIVHDSTLVACRPSKTPFIKKIYAYEVFGSTLDFKPDYYVDITKFIEKKINALSEYKTETISQTRKPDTIKKLAEFRGIEVNLQFAEGFKLLREVA